MTAAAAGVDPGAPWPQPWAPSGEHPPVSTPLPPGRLELEARLLRSIAQPVVAVDVDFCIVYWNRAAAEVVGGRADEVLGEPVLDLLGIELSEARTEGLLAQLEDDEVVVEDFVVRRRDGSSLPILVTLTPMLGADEQLAGVVAVASAISERKKAEETMARLSAIVEWSSDAIIRMDL